jgi:6-phosphogluconolactonase
MKNVVVKIDADGVAKAIANIIAGLSNETDRPAPAIALSGGSTPQRLYRFLASDEYRDQVNWNRLHWFWGDERLVPYDHPDSNTRMVREAMLDKAGVPSANIHLVPVDAPTTDEAALRYEQDLQTFYGARALQPGKPLFDLVLLGAGDDGHTASLFPGKPALEERNHWVAPVPEAGLSPFVPRVTLTFPALASSRQVAFLATGAGKCKTLEQIRAGARLPAADVVSEGTITWYLDAAAAG